jgi:signal transduction histidine kinase
VDSDPGLPDTIALSSAAANQIIDVLIDNAVVHGSGAVTVRAHDLGEAVAIDVSDEGPKLTTEAHDLFGPRDHSTHGIGLRFARRLAEAEGARLVVGAALPPTFRLVVPRRAANQVSPT